MAGRFSFVPRALPVCLAAMVQHGAFSADAITVECPPYMVVSESPAEESLGWSTGSFDHQAPLESLQVFWESPVEAKDGRNIKVYPEASIRPEVGKDGMLVFTGSGTGLWFECGYRGVKAVFWRHLPDAVRCQRPKGILFNRILCYSD